MYNEYVYIYAHIHVGISYSDDLKRVGRLRSIGKVKTHSNYIRAIQYETSMRILCPQIIDEVVIFFYLELICSMTFLFYKQ